jgi:hypothetical protein
MWLKKRKLRIISKIGLLFVVIGFFMPISCNLNGFQIARAVETFGGPNILSISLYSIFIFSCIGLILLCVLLMKKKFSIGYDWADLIIIITAFSVFMYGQIKSSDDPFLGIFSRLQSGAYIIFIGLAGSLFYLIAATGKSKKAKNRDVHGTTQSKIATDKVFIGEKVLSEDTIKKIKIREELFINLRRMQVVFLFLFFLFFFLLGSFPFIFYFIKSYYTYLFLSISGYIGMFIVPLFLPKLILFLIYNKKLFVYWRDVSIYDIKRENKKVHLGVSSLWSDWEDYYREGKYRRVSPSNFTIPADFTAIGDRAFWNWTSLASINMPASVTSIGNHAFRDCTSLISIIIPASVTTMGDSVFYGWTSAQTINVPFANANATPAGWDANWNKNCNAIIKYWNGTTWE